MNRTGMILAFGLAAMAFAACAPEDEGASAEPAEAGSTAAAPETTLDVESLDCGSGYTPCDATYQYCVQYCAACGAGVRSFSSGYCSSGPPIGSSPGFCTCG